MMIASRVGTDLERAAISQVAQYNDYFTDEGRLRETDAHYRWVLRQLGATHGTLLDVACGEGHLMAWAQKFGLHPVGLDFSPVAVATASRVSGSRRVIVGDGQSLPFPDRTFDFVTNLGSLEHFVEPERGLQEMRRVARPSGRVGLFVPNSYCLLDIIWHVWRRGYPASHSQIIERFATYGQWRDLIEANGLRVLHCARYNMCLPRTLYDVGWYLRAPRKLAFPLASPITPFNLSYSFLFICAPA